MSFLRRRKNKLKTVDKKEMDKVIEQGLAGYIKREELQEYLEKIKKDEKKKELWDSLSRSKKLKVLRHVMAKKGVGHGKK